MAERRVVVTGATGLVGRSLVAKLIAGGDEVVAIGRGERPASLPGEVAYHTIDLSCLAPTSLNVLGKFDGVVHLAQGSGWHDFPRAAGMIASIGIAATAHLAECAVAAGAKTFVFASSGGIYGPSDRPIVETDPIRPAAELGFYLAAKASAEQLLAYFSPHITVHILRPFFVYGRGQTDQFLLPRIAKSVGNGTPIRINAGRGPLLNPLHADDAAECFRQAIRCDQPVVANLGGPDVVSLRSVAEMIGRNIGKTPSFDIVPEEPQDFVADISIMSHALVAPKVSIDLGIAELQEPAC